MLSAHGQIKSFTTNKMDIKTAVIGLKNTCDSYLILNEKYLNDAKVNKRKDRKITFEKNRLDLLTVQRMILDFELRIDNEPVYSFNYFNYFNKWFFLNSKLMQNNPEDYFFPFRFFSSSFSAKIYIDTRTNWEQNNNLNETLTFLYNYVRRRAFFNKLLFLFGIVERNNLTKDRSQFMNEIKNNFMSKYYLSSTLVAVTQIEGLIWDFAKAVNSEELKIYYESNSQFFPFNWDEENQAYLKNKKRLTSARSLLMETRLQEVIPFELYSFLISEFWDDRNSLAHGDILNRNLKSDSIASLLCLMAVLMFLAKYNKNDNVYIPVAI
ncbi:MAG: hypothetical protein A2499_16125 [Stygiobacter sp. RIFOXYC12_FULL_38_8]|nr:MAG: hypothetical protein A2X62_08135 [Stygiobacter sp. GWC2_38_9]OGV07059.1 MAG: hypothetical protein A2299_03755 [Stygiobacter sp. RIFOXYB2_FULL_37_11]OGV10431.1 MAG: hypothetical protein A2237_03870 [Stygiobacter sp. RIFOXYA2_FULL_38_8]OGV12424.1 MAG: hypothetical protein A2440_14300 [Stygiobacter sp. RIFOXYC2_FULL_38_25]OGV24054.1 MAG: hypothetical protein A2499_16125 [Stygiobacter sp. RIFOXYC12_FULL_38_8]OGV83024.1 MAG: hypothetical protein A2X65_11075 [Stygiobacter sp. GWF2_38_21]